MPSHSLILFKSKSGQKIEENTIISDAIPFVSIIVLNYNGKNFLNACLLSLSKIDYPKSSYEVIMVDNGSVDGSVEYVRKNFPWVHVVTLNKNYGFGGGNNIGIRFARGEYLVFLNNDTRVTKDWLSKLVQALTEHSATICASKTLFMDNSEMVEYGGGKFTINGRGYSVALRKKYQEENECVYTGYPCAASMLIKKDVFHKLGGFDEDYFACLEDTDLGWRAWLYGYRVVYCPASIVYHVAGGTTGRGRISPLKAFQGTKNSFLNILKNLELKNLLIGIMLAFLYDLIEILHLVKCRDIECIKMKIKAYYWVTKNLQSIIQKRLVVQRNRTISDKYLLNVGLMASFKEALHAYVRLRKLDQFFLERTKQRQFSKARVV